MCMNNCAIILLYHVIWTIVPELKHLLTYLLIEFYPIYIIIMHYMHREQ